MGEIRSRSCRTGSKDGVQDGVRGQDQELRQPEEYKQDIEFLNKLSKWRMVFHSNEIDERLKRVETANRLLELGETCDRVYKKKAPALHATVD